MKNLFRFNSLRWLALLVGMAISLPVFSQNDCKDFVYFDVVVVEEDANQAVVDIVVSNFADIASFQFSLNYDQASYNLDDVDTHPNLQSTIQFNNQLDQGAAFVWVDVLGSAASVDDGSILMTLRFSKDGEGDSSFLISSDPVGMEITRFSNGDFEIICISSEGQNPSASLQGHVRYNEDGACTYNDSSPSLPFAKVRIYNSEFERIVSTNNQGKYLTRLEPGQYSVEVISPSEAWSTCDAAQISIVSLEDELTTNLTIAAQEECVDLNVAISANFLRRCFDNTYYVYYSNVGTTAVNDAQVEVVLDPFFIPMSSDLEYVQDGQVLVFDIGDLAPFESGRFSILGNLSCDAELGQAHCSEASILPRGNCGIQNYSGAIIEVEGSCTGDQVEFKVKNTGDNSTIQSIEIIVVEDDVMRESYDVILEPDEEKSYSFPANGSTYRVLADQVNDYPYPSSATTAIESCGTNASGESSIGFLTAFAEDLSDPNRSIDCQENIGSFDPNDKQGFPKGYGDPHYIYPEDRLDYLIRFQNTGTDTAFKVRIVDTLSTLLDVSTFEAGASSHPYTSQIDGRVITFTFDPIALVDSTRNEPASNGFVSFTIESDKDIPLGSVVENFADIYFDFNEPVRTNTTLHTVDRDFLKNATSVTSIQYLQMGVYPNPIPINGLIYFYVEDITDDYKVEFYDIRGAKVQSLDLKRSERSCKIDFLESGTYMVKLITLDNQVYTNKLIIADSK